jgi:hypothetical protein
MLLAILTFLVVFVLIFTGIKTLRTMSDKEIWALTKTAGYSIIVAVVTLLLLTLIYNIF